MVQYCKRCVMPLTRPVITFNNEGICAGCISYENHQKVDAPKHQVKFNEIRKWQSLM